MIDKKPYRVKTEHLLLLDDCRGYSDCKECPAKEICESGLADDYIKQDLIDAREIIDKQESLIKEMREVLHATRSTYSEELLPYARSRHDELLEKTKEYI